MPVSVEVDSEHGLIETTAAGTVTGADLLAAKRRLAADRRIHPGMRAYVELDGITDLQVTAADIDALIDFERAHPGFCDDIRTSLHASSDLLFGMARMYQQRSVHEAHVAVFRCARSARAWLDDEADRP